MECAGKGRRTRCIGPPTRRCGRCGAVSYCSASHQLSHWNDHKLECERLEQQMKRVDLLNDFPFTFAQEATFEIYEKKETRCSFFSKRGIHRLGMWICECQCAALRAFSDSSSSTTNAWGLSSELCPCRGPISLVSEHIRCWMDYYQWRCIPLHSPVAMLLHWPLTIYYAACLTRMKSLNHTSCKHLCIHYLGPEKELLQLPAFGELHALFPGVRVHIELIGPAVPPQRDNEKIDICNYAYCLDENCICKSSSENAIMGSSSVTVQLHRGYYHDCFRELAKVYHLHLLSFKYIQMDIS
ncbi:hypothetical protein K2173_022068 [Erythroxylum novogranatense]|uniref:MYND-type domain-containing protein n=1 Tax=Erythroxylum novogranatense TaxID=1862640 RepID=A0AAV8T436_9ROSI|nr:hypothetical protein K2173_022068 [Erythroxylum novogranatense]